MKKVLATTATILFALGCFAQGDKLFRVELRLPKTEYVLGEPVWCNEVFFYAPLIPSGAMEWEAVHVKGPVRAACHADKRLAEQGMQIGKPEPGPPEFTRTFLLSDCGIVDAGEYELWTEYPADLYFNRTYAPTPTAPLVSSNHVRVKIVAPAGIDAEVFEAHHERCNKITLGPQELLDKYPTSTYAGYALLTCSASFGCGSYDCFDDAEETLRRECSRGGGEASIRACMEREREKMRAYAKAAGPFLEAHPDFYDVGRIRRLYAYCLAFTGKVDEAFEQVRVLSKSEGDLGKEAKNFLEKRTAGKQIR